MTKQEFIDAVKEILEVDELAADQELEAMDEFDSLAVMSIVALLFSNFNQKASGTEIKDAKTVNGLIVLAGEDNFTA